MQAIIDFFSSAPVTAAVTLLTTLVVGYLSSAPGTAWVRHNIPPGSKAQRIIHYIHGLLDTIDPPSVSKSLRDAGPKLAIVFAIGAALSQQACAGTFDESRLVARRATPVKISTSERCIQLSDRARLEGALAKGGAVLTGASGLTVIPFEGKGERIALVGSTVLLAGGTALVMFLQESDAAAYIAEGCAQ